MILRSLECISISAVYRALGSSEDDFRVKVRS